MVNPFGSYYPPPADSLEPDFPTQEDQAPGFWKSLPGTQSTHQSLYLEVFELPSLPLSVEPTMATNINRNLSASFEQISQQRSFTPITDSPRIARAIAENFSPPTQAPILFPPPQLQSTLTILPAIEMMNSQQIFQLQQATACRDAQQHIPHNTQQLPSPGSFTSLPTPVTSPPRPVFSRPEIVIPARKPVTIQDPSRNWDADELEILNTAQIPEKTVLVRGKPGKQKQWTQVLYQINSSNQARGRPFRTRCAVTAKWNEPHPRQLANDALVLMQGPSSSSGASNTGSDTKTRGTKRKVEEVGDGMASSSSQSDKVSNRALKILKTGS